MTKEFLYDNANPYMQKLLHEFFATNVVIPKGATLQIKFNGEWDDVLTVYDTNNYRTKPQEPVYETMWYDSQGNTKWMTDNEADMQTNYVFEAKETKRERK